jgi:hypothetical protein
VVPAVATAAPEGPFVSRPIRIDSRDLALEDVPPPVATDGDVAGRDAVAKFAHTYNGYAQGGGPTRLVPLVAAMRQRWEETGEVPATLTDLRSALFLWHRADRHAAGSAGAMGREREWLNALLAGIRDVLADRGSG